MAAIDPATGLHTIGHAATKHWPDGAANAPRVATSQCSPLTNASSFSLYVGIDGWQCIVHMADGRVRLPNAGVDHSPAR